LQKNKSFLKSTVFYPQPGELIEFSGLLKISVILFSYFQLLFLRDSSDSIAGINPKEGFTFSDMEYLQESC